MGIFGAMEATVALLVSWSVAGLTIYLAVRRYRAGLGCASSVLWFFWTQLWVAIAAAAAGSTVGATGAILVYLAYAAWRVTDITQGRRADRWFARQYGSLTWHRVRYLGGHPDFREPHTKVILLVTAAGLVLVDKYRPRARILCVIPIDRLFQAAAHGVTNRVITWFSDMPLPIALSRDQGTLAVQFLNDVGSLSTVRLEVGRVVMAQVLKTRVDDAVHDWRSGRRGGTQGHPVPSST